MQKKQALCERAEALAPSSDWVKTAAELQALQAEWKAIGPVSRGHEKALWERFRAACDGFFSRRQEDLKKRKDEWSVNLAQKEALCDGGRAAGPIHRLGRHGGAVQAPAGPVEGHRSGSPGEVRSRSGSGSATACDGFFDRYKHRDQIEMQEKAAARTSVIADLEALVPSSGADTEAPDGLHETVQQARSAWQQAPELPRPCSRIWRCGITTCWRASSRRWPAAFAGTDLDPDDTRKRMEKLLARVEQLLRPRRRIAAPAASPAELLAQRWRERLAANTMTGGQYKKAEETQWREAEQEVRSAQQQWMRLGPVPASVAGPLNERFQRACRKFYDDAGAPPARRPQAARRGIPVVRGVLARPSRSWLRSRPAAQAPADGPVLTPLWNLTGDFAAPESAYYDAASKAVFVSSINGQILERDGNGYISRLTPDGKVVSAKWVTGLNAPKGLRSARQRAVGVRHRRGGRHRHRERAHHHTA